MRTALLENMNNIHKQKGILQRDGDCKKEAYGKCQKLLKICEECLRQFHQ